MPRARNIKPGFYSSEQLGRCSYCARLLFPALWQLCDREGRLEERLMQIRSYAFPYDPISVEQVTSMLAELEAENLIERYESGGRKIISVVTFAVHQNPHPNEKKSVLPKNSPSTLLQVSERSVASNGALSEHSASFAAQEPGKITEHSASFFDSSRKKILLNPESGILNHESLLPRSASLALDPNHADPTERPEYWSDRLRDLHRKPSARYLVEQHIAGHWARIGNPAKFKQLMTIVEASLVEWVAHWEATGEQFAPKLEAWLLAESWTKRPPRTTPTAAPVDAEPTIPGGFGR